MAALSILSVLLLPMASGGLTALAEGDDPEIDLSSDTVATGDTIRISGKNFETGESGQIVWSATGTLLAQIESDDDGGFAADVIVPPSEDGDYDIRAIVGDGDADAELTVQNPVQETPPIVTEEPIEVVTEEPTDVPTEPATEAATETPTEEVTEVVTEEPTEEAPTEEPASTEATTATQEPTLEPTTEPKAKRRAKKTATPSEQRNVAAAAASGALYVSTSGSDSAAGSEGAPFQTIQRALDVAGPGDTINLRGGTYRPAKTLITKTDGTSGAPITIRSAPGEHAVISGPGNSRGLQVNSDWYVITGLEFTAADNLLWLDGANNVVISGNSFHHAGGECVRIKNQSHDNTFRDNTVTDCGIEGFNLAAGSKNGEGVYIGTAPEQRYKIGGAIDHSTGNLVENNVFRTNGSEAVDIKEDAENNIVRYNVGSGNRDADGANFGVRGDNNQFIGNESFDSAGAGFRAGGDTVDGRVYGKDNLFRDNSSHDNSMHSYKFMVGPQDVNCSNVGARDGGNLFHFGTSRFTIGCGGGSATTPVPTTPAVATRTSTPRPVETSTPRPVQTSTPRPVQTSTPRPVQTSTPSPVGTVAPAPSKTATPATGDGDLVVREFEATDDTQAASMQPRVKFGASRTFRVDSGPMTISYLKFKVSDVEGDEIRDVTLRLYVTEAGRGLTIHRVGSRSWTEGGLDWSNHPRFGAAIPAAQTGSDASGTWVEFDLTGVVTDEGIYSFALTTVSGDGYTIASDEAVANQPSLVVRYDD